MSNETDKQELHSTDPKLKEMMLMLKEWHQSRIDQLTHVSEAGDDTTFEVQSEGGNPIKIEGDKRIGFKAGCAVAIELFSPFPVDISITEPEEEIDYICDGCGDVIDEEESEMFNGWCEECHLENQ